MMDPKFAVESVFDQEISGTYQGLIDQNLLQNPNPVWSVIS